LIDSGGLPKEYWPIVYSARGLSYGEKGLYDKAIADHSKVIELKPDAIGAYLSRAELYEQKGLRDKAIEDYRAVNKLDAKNEMALNSLKRLGVAPIQEQASKEVWDSCFNQSISDDARIGFCTQLIDGGSLSKEYLSAVYVSRGFSYNKKSLYDKAIADFSKAIEIKPDYTDAYLRRGGVYYKKGNLDEAIADYKEVVKLDPKNQWVLDILKQQAPSTSGVQVPAETTAGCVNPLTSAEERIGFCTQLIESGSLPKEELPDMYDFRADAYSKKGIYDKAIADYNKAIELKPDKIQDYIGRGIAYDRKGLYDEAIADYNKAIKLKPDFSLGYLSRGISYENKGLVDEAIADYSKVIELKPGANIYKGRAALYEKKKLYDMAIADYSKVIEFKPDYAEVYNNRAWDYHLKGEDAKGLPDAEKAVGLAPTDTYFLETRAEIEEKLGQKDKAIADYDESIKSDSKNSAAIDGLKRLGATP
jgi:tetratricopeptide (TPR) repeat protein